MDTTCYLICCYLPSWALGNGHDMFQQMLQFGHWSWHTVHDWLHFIHLLISCCISLFHLGCRFWFSFEVDIFPACLIHHPLQSVFVSTFCKTGYIISEWFSLRSLKEVIYPLAVQWQTIFRQLDWGSRSTIETRPYRVLAGSLVKSVPSYQDQT